MYWRADQTNPQASMTRSSAGPPPPSDCSSSSSAASAAASRSNPARPPHPPTHPLHDRVPPQRRLGGGGPIRVARCVTCPARASAPGPLKLGRARTAGADVPSPWAGRRMLRRGARAPAKGSTSPARNAARKPPPPAQPPPARCPIPLFSPHLYAATPRLAPPPGRPPTPRLGGVRKRAGPSRARI